MATAQTGHLDPDTLAAYVDGRLGIAELGQADHHIDSCPSCRLELSTLAAIHTAPVAPAPDSPQGTLGRFHVLRELGRGSMGIVLRAYDPDLARPVAIKLVRDVDDSTRELVRREARALAKLRHPNVVTIYDVVLEGESLYVAMELVEGDTLRGYAKGRPTKEIVAALAKAGRGLAAAHDAGIIHRDFKPENVLTGENGEVKVSDFGLARVADEAPDRALAGTPAYMAPEVLRREPATAASDQFSFCVTAWELLTGERPTGGAPGAPKASVAFVPVPAWLIRVLRRGLERDPSARYSSMHELVAVLEDDPVARRRRRTLLGIGALAAIATGALIVKLAPAPSKHSCDIDASALSDTWTPVHRAAVLAGTAAAADAETAQRITSSLDAYTTRWLATRRDVCIAAREHTEPTITASRTACLDRVRFQLSALVDALSSSNVRLAKSFESARLLGDPSLCLAQLQVLPGDPGGRVIVAQGHRLLANANALRWSGRADESDTLAAHLLDHPGIDLVPSLRAEALAMRASFQVDRGHSEAAEELLFDALHAAERAHDDRLVAEIWVEIVSVTGSQQQRFDVALSNARAADAAIARIDPDPDMKVYYAYTLGTLLFAHGKLDEARARLAAVTELAAKTTFGEIALGQIDLVLCDIARQQGRLPDAKALCASGIAKIEKGLGPNNVRVAVSLSQPAALAFGEHDLDTAQKLYERAISIFELRHAEADYAYALSLSNLGAVYSERGDLPKAEAKFTQALALFERYHPAHPQRLMALQGMAGTALRRGDAAAAMVYYRKVRDLRAASLPPEHASVLAADFNLALAYRSVKDTAQAEKILADVAVRAQTPGRESWTIAGRALDLIASMARDRKDNRAAYALRKRALAAIEHVPGTSDHAYIVEHAGEDALYLRKFEEALPLIRRALAYYDAQPGADVFERESARTALALTLVALGDKAHAFEQADQALAALAKLPSTPGLEAQRRNLAQVLALRKRP